MIRLKNSRIRTKIKSKGMAIAASPAAARVPEAAPPSTTSLHPRP